MLELGKISKTVANDMFAAADVDASGTISFNEFVAVMFDPNAITLEQLRTHCLSVFSTLSNGGELTAEDFVAAFPSSSGTGIEDEVSPQIKALFKKIDANGDGGISLEEFTDFLQQM